MYNIEKKNEFLQLIEEQINERQKNGNTISSPDMTIRAYERIFKSSEKIEESYDVDLYDFDIDQVDEFMHARQPKSKASSRSVGRMVTKYINWAIEKGYRESNNNPLNVSQDYFNQFVVESENQFLSLEQIQDTMDYLINDQDAVIIGLLFNGVEGKESSEIRNLTIEDIDIDNSRVTVTDDKTGKSRVVDFSNDKLRTLNIAVNAHRESEYEKKNGEIEYNPHIKGTVDLPSHKETPYIIKTARTQGKHYMSKASQYTIYNRISMIKSLEGLEDYANSLNTKNIIRSGMIFEMYSILKKEGGDLDKEKIDRVCKKFNVNNHWAVRDFFEYGGNREYLWQNINNYRIILSSKVYPINF